MGIGFIVTVALLAVVLGIFSKQAIRNLEEAENCADEEATLSPTTSVKAI